jgi:hypothetical protein
VGSHVVDLRCVKRSPEFYVEVGHLQAKFTGHLSPHIIPHLWLLGSLERRLVAKVGNI